MDKVEEEERERGKSGMRMRSRKGKEEKGLNICQQMVTNGYVGGSLLQVWAQKCSAGKNKNGCSKKTFGDPKLVSTRDQGVRSPLFNSFPKKTHSLKDIKTLNN